MSAPGVDHYADRYWNDLPAVLAHLCRRSTGDPNLWWMDYVKAEYATPPRRRALVVGCGNGWVERDLFDREVAVEFDAFDASPDYLRQAREQQGGRAINYLQSDFASFTPEHTYDLVVNVAALHHAQRLYRIVKVIADALEPGGVFVNWDYVGPSRNQYPKRQVRSMAAVNDDLPPRFRTPHPLHFPLHDMLPVDPTEAVHAAEILRAVGRRFDFLERHDLGGGLAYQLLWNNLDEYEQGDAEASETLDRLLRLDEEATENRAVPNLFSFFVCTPRRRPSVHAAYRERIYEPVREAFAHRARDYYPTELLRSAPGIAARRLRRAR